MEFIKVKGVSKAFNRKRVLEDINLTIQEGDVLGIIGQSGSGKTTLLNMIAGFIPPSVGEVVYISKVSGVEKNLTRNIHKIKKHIGFTPQHNSFYPKLTVKENLFHFGRLYGVPEKTLINNMKSLLNVMKLMEHRNTLASHLSGGMQRRLDISCSLVHKPKVLILDEPTADLDPLLQKEILQLLRQVNKQGVTIILASHNLESVETICNKVALFHKGKNHIQGSLEEVRRPFLRNHFKIKVRPGAQKDIFIQQLQTMGVQRIIDEGHTLVVHPTDLGQTVIQLLQLAKQHNLIIQDVELRKLPLTEVFETIARQE